MTDLGLEDDVFNDLDEIVIDKKYKEMKKKMALVHVGPAVAQQAFFASFFRLMIHIFCCHWGYSISTMA